MPLRRRRLPTHHRLQSRRLGSYFEKLEERRVFAAVALDPGFGVGGFATHSFLATTAEGESYDSSDDASNAVLRQADGKALVAGTTYNNLSGADVRTDFILARYNEDGSLDETFGDQGVVRTDFGKFDYGRSIALQSDGKIVMVGETSNQDGLGFDMTVARYLPNGELDAAFDGDGKAIIDFQGTEEGRAIAVGEDGSIVVGGSSGPVNVSYPQSFAVARLLSDGSLDEAFGSGGKALFHAEGGSGNVRSLVLLPGGKVVVAGSSASPQEDWTGLSEYDFALARLNADGSVDETFGNQGFVATDLSGGFYDEARRLLVGDDGKLIAAGFVNGPGAGVVQYNSDGSLDTNFGDDGVVVLSGAGGFRDAAIQANGKIQLLGQFFGDEIRLVRLLPNGQADISFGIAGEYIAHFPFEQATPFALHVSDDKALVAGANRKDGNGDFALAQFLLDTNPPSFTLARSEFLLMEDAPGETVVDFAQNISTGLPDGGQLRFVTFVVVSDTPDLFEQSPEIDNTGTLRFQTASHAVGEALVAVQALNSIGDIAETQYFRIDVSPVNDAPILDEAVVPALRSSPEDVRQSHGTPVWELLAGVTDADRGALRGIAVTAAINTVNGVTAGDWQFLRAGSPSWSYLFVPAGSARLIPSDARVRFVPNANFNGDVTLEFHAWDRTTGNPGEAISLAGNVGGDDALSIGKATATLSVTPVNDAPVLDNTVATWWPKVMEDGVPPERRVSTLLWGATDVDAGAQRGIAVTAAKNFWGTWEYKLNGSDTWQDMSHAAETSAVLLPEDALVRYVPNTNRGATLWFSAWDQTAGAAGGTMDLTGNKGGARSVSIGVDSVWLDVTPVNDAPVLDVSLNPTLNTIHEDDRYPVVTRVEKLIRGAISDADENALRGIAVIGASSYNGSWEYFSPQFGHWISLGGAHVSQATMLTPQTDIRFVPKRDFHGEVKLYYRAWDQTGRFADSRFNSGGSKHMSAEVESATLTVLPDRGTPSLQLSGSVDQKLGGYQVPVAPQAVLREADSFQFNGARLAVHILYGAEDGNSLFLGAMFTVDNKQRVLQEGRFIGRLTSNGQGRNDLVITFNANANPATVELAIRMVMFQTDATAAPGRRTLLFAFTGADGQTTLTASKSVRVI